MLTALVGPWDPNDKQVSDTLLSLAQAQEWLTYTIHFQNVGNDTAFSVVIADTLSANLDMTSLEVLDTSHPASWRLGKNNVLHAVILNIMLPDSTIKEQASHGFLKYRARVQPDMAIGETVHNKAAITFDYNAPVVTNTVVTSIVSVTQTPVAMSKPRLQVYPNPVQENLREQLPKAGNWRIEVVDALGKRQLVREPGNSVFESCVLQLGKLASGIYLVRAVNGTEQFSAPVRVE